MAVYKGEIERRTEHRLIKDGIELRPRKWTAADDYHHYFSWGNAGSGAHQLAMTILVEEGLPVEEARSLHHAFCITFIAMLDSNTDWELTSNELTLQIAAVKHNAQTVPCTQCDKELHWLGELHRCLDGEMYGV